MKDYASKKVKQGKVAFRTPSRFIYQKYRKVIKLKSAIKNKNV
jgi:hypothetical protein